MITSRGLVEGDEHTRDMLVFDELETTRSVQLYGTDPVYVGKATEILCAEYGVAHIDLNFGCPVPKVTRKGGGGALPWKRGLLAEILTAAVAAADAVRRAGDHEDPQGPRRRPPDLPRRRPDRAGDRRAPPSRCTGGPSRSPTPARPTGRRSPGSSSTSTSRCSATATSGRPPTRCGWSSRPVPPASWSAAAAWAGRGCSATSRRPSRATRSRRCRRSARCAT